MIVNTRAIPNLANLLEPLDALMRAEPLEDPKDMFPGLMAASFMMSVPVVVLFLLLQRYFVRALTEGAVKH